MSREKELFGQVFKEAREKKNLSQEAVAFESGVDRPFISLVENGKKQPTIETLFRLSRGIAVPADDLIREVRLRLEQEQ